jgi:23S rRNA pseudouridine2604 synthase
MCQYLGYQVKTLKRIRIMNITLGNLKEGTYRDVTRQEWSELRELIRDSSNETVIRTAASAGKERTNGRK